MSVAMDRVRGAQYQELEARVRGGLLRGKMFLHLKQDLADYPVDWEGCDEPYQRPATEPENTTYGVRKDIQRALANLRTDLDAFSDTEAYSLMLSGYRMCGQALAEGVGELPKKADEHAGWIFRDAKLEAAMSGKDSTGHDRVKRLLTMGESALQKERWLRVVGPAVGVLLLVALFWFSIQRPQTPLMTLGQLGWMVGGLLVGAVVGNTLIKALNWQSTLRGIVVKLAVAFSGWLLAWVQLLVFDPLFLKKGRLQRPASAKPA